MTDPIRSRRDARTRAELLASVEEADRHLAAEAARRPDLAPRIRGWRGALARIPEAVRRAEARVAFVGAVKSGKSTLVNALLGEDLLPRGSGILTAQVTEVARAGQAGLRLVWRSRHEINETFRAHMEALGSPGPWDLWSPADRETAGRVLGAAGASPHRAAAAALLRGAGAAGARTGETRREERLAGSPGLWERVARDEVAAFLAGLRVLTPAPDLPQGVVLLDCPGSDAWNAAHGREVDEAVLSAHALVYVISSRVGLREADIRFIEALGGYGLLGLTRFVLNVDLGEIRDRADLRRVLDATDGALRELGAPGPVVAASALLGLLDARVLLDPEGVADGERRLREAWESAAPGLAAELRDAFRSFRDGLWAEARTERDRIVLTRARADLRRVLVEAGRELGAAGGPVVPAVRAAWRADVADSLLEWMHRRMDAAAEQAREAMRSGLARAFRARRAPQRRAWADRVRRLDPAPGRSVWEQAEAILAATEPLRVNAVRNLALEARGALARAGEAVAAAAARALERAGLDPGEPPLRGALAREITATRRIPLFRGRTGAAQGEATALGRLVRGAGRGLRRRLAGRPGSLAAQRVLLQARLARAWDAYLDEVLEGCLLPHVDEAAAQVYDCLAAWALSRLPREPAGRTEPAS